MRMRSPVTRSSPCARTDVTGGLSSSSTRPVGHAIGIDHGTPARRFGVALRHRLAIGDPRQLIGESGTSGAVDQIRFFQRRQTFCQPQARLTGAALRSNYRGPSGKQRRLAGTPVFALPLLQRGEVAAGVASTNRQPGPTAAPATPQRPRNSRPGDTGTRPPARSAGRPPANPADRDGRSGAGVVTLPSTACRQEQARPPTSAPVPAATAAGLAGCGGAATAGRVDRERRRAVGSSSRGRGAGAANPANANRRLRCGRGDSTRRQRRRPARAPALPESCPAMRPRAGRDDTDFWLFARRRGGFPIRRQGA